MAKLGSCRPPLQARMLMLLALLLLASIQAGPVMAGYEAFVDLASEFGGKVGEKIGGNMGETLGEKMGEKAPGKIANTVANMGFTAAGRKGYTEFRKGGKMGLKIYKRLCKVQDRMEKQNPGGGTPYLDLHCWSSSQQVPAAGALPPSPSTVRIMGIRVDHEELLVQTPPAAVDGSLYGRLMEAVERHMKALNPWAVLTSSPPTADKLCYAAWALSAPRRLPDVAFLLPGDNNDVMAPTTLELEGSETGNNLWYYQEKSFCLGIRRTMEGLVVLGRP